MKRTRLLLLLAVALALGALGVGARASNPTPEATLTYYFIPGCSTCARTTARIKEVLAPHCGRVALRLVENRSPEGRAAAARHGFATHGLVLSDSAGASLLVESDHRIFPEHVAEALERLPR